jgi:hypothetical protein
MPIASAATHEHDPVGDDRYSDEPFGTKLSVHSTSMVIFGWADSVGVQNLCHYLRALDEAGARPDEMTVGVHCPDLRALGETTGLRQIFGEPNRGFEVISAGRDDHDISGGGPHGTPGESLGVLPRVCQQRSSTPRDDQVGNPVTGAEGGISPLQHQDIASFDVAEVSGQELEALTQATHEAVRVRRDPEYLANHEDRFDHVVETSRVECHHTRRTAQVFERVLHPNHIDGTHRTQVLRQHNVSIEIDKCLAVEMVQVVSGRHSCRHDRIDLRRRQSLGQRRRRHHPPRSRSRRVVTLERDTNEVITPTESKDDLRR